MPAKRVMLLTFGPVVAITVLLQSAMSQQLTQIVGGTIINDGDASISTRWVDYDNDGK